MVVREVATSQRYAVGSSHSWATNLAPYLCLGRVLPLKSLLESLVCLASPSSDGQAVLSAPPSKTKSKHKCDGFMDPWLHQLPFPGSVGEYLPPFDIPTMNNVEFDFGMRIGMLFLVEAFATSALAVTGLLLYIAVRFQCGGHCLSIST